MIKINKANKTDTAVLALLGTLTYTESHGHFIANKDDLTAYVKTAFSVSKTRQDLNNPNHIFYIVYADDLPVGYAKLVLNATHESVEEPNSCQLERIYILSDFIHLKLGHQLLTFLEGEAKALQLDTLWLSVYIKNERAIRFYKRNDFIEVGKTAFLVNGKNYENIVFSKRIE